MSVLRAIGLTIVGLLVITGIVFGLAYAGIGFTGFFGPKQAAVQQKVFQNSRPYVEGAAQDLAKEKLELSHTKDKASRAAIVSYLNQEYGNMNPDLLSNPSLREFLIEIQNGEIH